MKKNHKNKDNENTMEYDNENESTKYSKVRQIIFLFSGLFFIGIGCFIFFSVRKPVGFFLLPLALGLFSIKEVFFPYNKKK